MGGYSVECGDRNGQGVMVVVGAKAPRRTKDYGFTLLGIGIHPEGRVSPTLSCSSLRTVDGIG